jgi:hypothetical protein
MLLAGIFLLLSVSGPVFNFAQGVIVIACPACQEMEEGVGVYGIIEFGIS